jgi:hypothetical protein
MVRIRSGHRRAVPQRPAHGRHVRAVGQGAPLLSLLFYTGLLFLTYPSPFLQPPKEVKERAARQAAKVCFKTHMHVDPQVA